MSVRRKKQELDPASAADSGVSEQEQGATGGGDRPAAPGEEAASVGGSSAESPASRDGAASQAIGPTAAAGEPEGPAAADILAQAEARIEELDKDLVEARDQLLRKAADFDNTRKRMARDKEEGVRFANNALLLDLVEVIDGFERAIASSESSRDFAALHQGVVLIEKQLVDTLQRKWGLERMSALGQPFDPRFHQAVTVGEAVDAPEPVVLEEFQSGYLLHERVIRPAKVRVSAARRAEAAVEGGEGAPRDSAPPAGESERDGSSTTRT